MSGNNESGLYTLQVRNLKHYKILEYLLKAMELFDSKQQQPPQLQGESEQQGGLESRLLKARKQDGGQSLSSEGPSRVKKRKVKEETLDSD